MPKFIDLTGQRFGRLTVIRRVEDNKHNQPMWLCSCECGAQKTVNGANLRCGKTRSCGCYGRDQKRQICLERNTSHGLSGSRTHIAWVNMLQRCNNPNATAYHKYGARGTSVCERWHSFDNFLADMGECAQDQSIDRIDNSRGYEPGNCRWVTMRAQQNNRRSNRKITHKGTTLTLQQWADRSGIKREVISGRLKRGWPVGRALTERPVKGRNQYS